MPKRRLCSGSLACWGVARDESPAVVRTGDGYLPHGLRVSDLSGVAVGDELLLFGHYDGSGEGRPVVVVKVGRKLLHVDWPDAKYPSPDTYRIDSGRRNDNYGHTYVRTYAQAAAWAERSRLSAALHDAGINFRLGRTPSLATMRAILAAMESDE